MKVAIYSRPLQEQSLQNFKKAYESLLKHPITLFIHHELQLSLEGKVVLASHETFNTCEDIQYKVDLLISLGGDGTLLDAATLVKNTGIPIVGINYGRLGFLASINNDEIESAIKSIIARQYTIESRNLLTIETSKNHFCDKNFALNDIIVQKRDSAAMMMIHTYVDDVFLNTYWSDGLIVSTPTGSSAYSLSCGGPIIHPKCTNILVTPISPHNLNVRPVVLPNNISLEIEVECRSENYLVSCDSRTEVLNVKERVRVKQANFQLNLVRINTEDYFSTLRNKMMWGLDKRN